MGRRRCLRGAAFEDEVFESVASIADPERPLQTLEELRVVRREGVLVRCTDTCPYHAHLAGAAESSSGVFPVGRECAVEDRHAEVWREPWEAAASEEEGEEQGPSAAEQEGLGTALPPSTCANCRWCCVVVSVHPTSRRCSLASVIALAVRCRVALDFAPLDASAFALFPPLDVPLESAAAATPGLAGLRVFVRVEEHDDSRALSAQINDKERVAAALERGALRELVLQALGEGDC